jgi:hypothetical protein
MKKQVHFLILSYINGLIPTYLVNRYCHNKLGQKILLIFLYVVVSNTFIAWASTFLRWPLSFPIWIGWPPDWPGPPEDWFVSINFFGEPIRYWYSGEDFYFRAMAAIFLHMSMINVTLGLLGLATIILSAPAEKYVFRLGSAISEKIEAEPIELWEEIYEKLLGGYMAVYGAEYGKWLLDRKIDSYIKQGLSRKEAVLKVAKKEGFN